MKLADYIAQFLAGKGIRHAFVVTGGAAAHIIDSIGRHPAIDYIPTQHEQAAAMAADAYSRVTGNLGVAVATSGPGATNLITGACCAFYDSIPVLFITGQVATFRSRKSTGVRQLGFQEADTVDIFKPLTKYAVLLEDPRRIRYELEKATFIATTGRPGPVLLDIPDNLQREEISPSELAPFIAEQTNAGNTLRKQVARCIPWLEQTRRPVVILGWGIHLSKAENEALTLVNKLGFPVLPTWATMDMLPVDHPLLVGSFGLHGTRYGNFTVQNADLVLSIGCRLDTHLTGSPTNTFAREARKIVVDIDATELNKYGKFGMSVDALIQADAVAFLRAINHKLDNFKPADITEWRQRVVSWKQKYPICPPQYYRQIAVNPYVFVKKLAEESAPDDVIFVDTGCGVAWMMQAFDFKPGQRLFSAFNNTPMGYALPASLGASLALGNKPVTCVTGDGGLQINIQELATIIRFNLPVRIFLLNNHGYSMIRQTQDQWLDSRYAASTVEGGLASPDFVKIAAAYGYRTINITTNNKLGRDIRKVLDSPGPVFCNVEISPAHRVIPQVKYGRPIEDGEPLLDRQEFLANMIVKPLEISLK